MPRSARPKIVGALLALTTLACGASDPAGPSETEMRIVSMSPAPRTVVAPVGSPIVLRFDRPVRRDSVVLDRTLHVFGRWSGTARGRIDFADGDRTVAFVPERPFSAGETVIVLVAATVTGTDGAALRPTGFSAQFWTRAQPSAAAHVETERLFTRTAGFALSRAYGGIASDLDGDGRLDLAIVNEDSSDLAVYRNRGGSPATFAEVPGRFALGRRASPSEPADFDRDGHTDIAVANIGDGTVSVLLGRGDGTFAPAQVVTVGPTPRGIAVVDIDGDADLDLAVTSVGSSDVAILVNEAGRFRVFARVESGAEGEWAIGTADLDEDGVLDVVVGASQDRRLVGLRNEGAGRFTPWAGQDAGGSPWMIATGDLDGDGHDDVAVANGRSNTAAVARGDGRGGFGPAAVQTIDPFGLASDLGDLDGDGDLDWVTSSFSGDWRLHENVGGGVFHLGAEIAPRNAASCALIFDADGDGDLDLALIDEVADEVIVMQSVE